MYRIADDARDVARYAAPELSPLSGVCLPEPCQSPLLSILIPTKDRYDTLVPMLTATISYITDAEVEFVVCDSSANPDPSMISLAASDSRIRYVPTADARSIVDNVDRGIAACEGRYICFIGDDDFVAPQIADFVRWMDSKGDDCLIYPPARFWWQNVSFKRLTRFQQPGAFWLPAARQGAVRRRRSADEMRRVQDGGGVAYLDLPRLYHGIASRRAVDRIHERFGRYVPGSSPDMALCAALSEVVEEYSSIDFPITVFGASRASGGGRTAAGRHYGRIEDQAHLPRDIIENWNPALPRIWSEQVIYPQTLHEVARLAGSEAALSRSTLYASLIAYEPHIVRFLLPNLRQYLRERPLAVFGLFKNILLKAAGRARVGFRLHTGIGLGFELHVLRDGNAVMALLAGLKPPEQIRQTVPRT
jgi:hypothetical protein